MALLQNTKPSLLAITLSEAKDHLRITHDNEDGVIIESIRGATNWVENYLGWRLLTQTWTLYLDQFPADIIRLPYPPLQSVTWIKYYDSNNVQQTYVENTDYRVDIYSYPARIEPINGWDGVYDKIVPVEIKFICGFTSADLIDDQIKGAIKLRLADLYENRQDAYLTIGSRIEMRPNTISAKNLLEPFKLYDSIV